MPTPAIREVGRERQPLVVIDDFAPDPDALRDAASAASFGPAGHHYPGIRARLPPDYWADRRRLVDEAIGRAFGLGPARVIDASFSIVTTPPGALSVRQRLPHCDAFGPDRIALLHYLSPDGGGTAFYRHRATGFETVDEARAPIFFGQLEAELRHGGAPPAGYLDGDTALFERTALAEPRFNRALLYRSFVLHSGAIAPDAVLSGDPAQGRLTVTGFLQASPVRSPS